MKASHAIQGKTSEIKLLIESYGFVSPAIFGSTARGTDVDGSDLDILATLPADLRGKISLFDIQHLEEALEALTGVAVDFNIENAMPDRLRPSIEREKAILQFDVSVNFYAVKKAHNDLKTAPQRSKEGLMCRFRDTVAAIEVITTGAKEYAVRTGCFVGGQYRFSQTVTSAVQSGYQNI